MHLRETFPGSAAKPRFGVRSADSNGRMAQSAGAVVPRQFQRLAISGKPRGIHTGSYCIAAQKRPQRGIILARRAEAHRGAMAARALLAAGDTHRIFFQGKL
jgi:hypothetical protein